MADNTTLVRVVDLVAQDTLDALVYGLIDSETGGTKKYPLGSKLLEVDQEISDINDETADIKRTAETAYITDTVSGAVASFPDGADDVPVKSLSVNIEPAQSGSGDPSPDNVREISGWDTVNVYRASENLWGGQRVIEGVQRSLESPPQPDTDAGTISFTAAATVATNKNDFTFNTKFKENTQYTFLITYNKSKTNMTSNMTIRYTDGTIERISSLSTAQTKERTVTVSAAGKTVAELRKNNSSGTTILYYDECAILEGVHTADDFVPYVGDVYDIDLPQTVYGGTLDVSTGTLTVTHVAVDMGTLTWSRATGNNYRNFNAVVADLDYNSTVPYVIADCYKAVAINAGATADGDNYIYSRSASATSNTISIKDTSKADMTAEEFKTAMSGHYAVYKTTTPTTLTLTPEQVTTLLGQNNIYADSGEVSVIYRADPKLYIQKLTGSTESDMVADTNINANTYFMVGNNLYISTAAIGSGEAITPGTNCTQVTLAEALNTLNQ